MFVDTSVLVYIFDSTEPERQQRARAFVAKVFEGKSKATVSNQVIGELCNTLLTKTRLGGHASDLARLIESLNQNASWKKVNYSNETAREALRISLQYGIDYWDAVIAATMKENNESEIITDNWKDFEKIPWLKVRRL